MVGAATRPSQRSFHADSNRRSRVRCSRIEDEAELGLRVSGLVGDLELRLGVFAEEHEVADDLSGRVVAESNDHRGREATRLVEHVTVVVEVGGGNR